MDGPLGTHRAPPCRRPCYHHSKPETTCTKRSAAIHFACSSRWGDLKASPSHEETCRRGPERSGYGGHTSVQSSAGSRGLLGVKKMRPDARAPGLEGISVACARPLRGRNAATMHRAARRKPSTATAPVGHHRRTQTAPNTQQRQGRLAMVRIASARNGSPTIRALNPSSMVPSCRKCGLVQLVSVLSQERSQRLTHKVAGAC